MKPLLTCGVVAAALALSVSARADDVVLLKNGGRLRGQVTSEDPKEGVKIKLADGRMRVVAAAEVKEVIYEDQPKAPPPPAPAPPPVPATPVPAPAPTEAPAASGDEYASLRQGFHFGASLGFTSIVSPITAGATGSFVANLGVSRYVDLRASLRLTAGHGTDGYGTAGLVDVPIDVRFNLGSVYSMGLGFWAGALIVSESCTAFPGFVTTCGVTPSGALPFFGPELTLTSFRAGPKRQIEIEVLGGLGIVMSSSSTPASPGFPSITSHFTQMYPRVSLSVTYLFL